MIDPKAIIDSTAKIAKDAHIGPYAIIGPHVEIGAGTSVSSHAVISAYTKIGRNNKIFQFASVGEEPQDKKFQGEITYLEIGDNNIFREFCTINRGTGADKSFTKIGNNNLFMAYTHVAHDCIIGDHIVFANNASVSGHVEVEDYAILSGFSAVHQFCRIGQYSFLCAGAIAVHDVPPFSKAAGVFAKPYGLNSIGLQRRNFDQKTRTMLKAGYRMIYRQNLTIPQALEKLQTLKEKCPEISLYIDFLKKTQRGIIR